MINYAALIKKINKLPEDEKTKHANILAKNKELYLQQLQEQKYLSTLKNDNMRLLYNTLKNFDNMLKQQQHAVEKTKKPERVTVMEKERYETEKAKQQPQSNGELLAKQKREAFQKKKKEETEAKKRLAIEGNEDK